MGYKGEVFFPASLHFQGALRCIGLHGHANGLVEDPVQDVEGGPLQAQTFLLGQVVNAATQNVVLCDNLLQIKSLLQTLQPMGWRAGSFDERFGNCFVRLYLERGN